MKAQVYCDAEQCFVIGDLDFSTIEKLWKESLALLALRQDLKLDLSHVTFANSAGLALLIEWVKYANEKKKPISFINIPVSILSLAKISGIDQLLNTV